MHLAKAWIICLALPALASAITPDEIRAMDDAATQQQRSKSNQVTAGKADAMLPAPKPAPRFSKYDSAAASSASSAATHTDEGTAAAAPSRPASTRQTSEVRATMPVVPSVAPAATEAAMRTSGVSVSTKKFGIPLGSWFRVRLARNVSNAESGQVELTTTEDVPGNARTLPAGTVFFADKAFNSGTKRLDCRLARGITPKGVEFTVRASCFDLQKQAGLNGVVSFDEKAVVNTGVQKGTLAALRSVARNMAGTTGAVVAGASGAADSVLNDASQAAEQIASSPYTIYVAPQDILVRVDESF
jgi:Bacterial conjugation TrbI-like protein